MSLTHAQIDALAELVANADWMMNSHEQELCEAALTQLRGAAGGAPLTEPRP